MKIFVSFVYKKSEFGFKTPVTKFDWAILNIDSIETEDDVKEIIDKLQDSLNQEDITILSWKRLS